VTAVAPIACAALLLALVPGCRGPKGETKQQKRNHVQQVKKEALAQLYREQPEAKAQLQRAPGYAVFSSVGSKILMLATGSGFGVAVNNRSGKQTYMRMIEAGGGVGIGIKTYKAIYIFNSKEAFDTFVTSGWQAGGDADIGAKMGDQGAEAGADLNTDQVTRPVTVYQFTENGVSLSAVATGTKYYPDDELN